jgi:hypothetical protein
VTFSRNPTSIKRLPGRSYDPSCPEHDSPFASAIENHHDPQGRDHGDLWPKPDSVESSGGGPAKPRSIEYPNTITITEYNKTHKAVNLKYFVIHISLC